MILLDTSTWIWMTSDPTRLSGRAMGLLEKASEVLVSAISGWEVGMLVAKGRIKLDRPVDRWVDEAIRAPKVRAIPVDHQIGVLSTMLPSDPPSDPADRLLIASALTSGAMLVTPDNQILDYPYCPTAW